MPPALPPVRQWAYDGPRRCRWLGWLAPRSQGHMASIENSEFLIEEMQGYSPGAA